MIATIGRTLPALRVVVFAAGLSSRLGQPKALTRVRGVSLLRRTVRLLAPFTASRRLIVVVPPRCSRYRIGIDPARVDFIVNPHRERGLSSSVLAGIRRARCSAAVLLLPVDLVELQAGDIARLIARWRGARRKVAARRVGGHPGTPLILPRTYYPESLQTAGGQGLRDAVGRLPSDCVRMVSLPSAAMDVDTPQDLARARRRVPAGRPLSRSQPLAFCTSR